MTDRLRALLDADNEADRLIRELDALDGGATARIIADCDRIIAEALALLDAGPADGLRNSVITGEPAPS